MADPQAEPPDVCDHHEGWKTRCRCGRCGKCCSEDCICCGPDGPNPPKTWEEIYGE